MAQQEPPSNRPKQALQSEASHASEQNKCEVQSDAICMYTIIIHLLILLTCTITLLIDTCTSSDFVASG